MSEVLDLLSTRLAAVEAQLAELTAQADAYRRVIADLSRAEAERRAAGARASSQQTLASLIESILLEQGRPLHYRDIHRRLTALGVDVPGKDPVKNVGAHLSGDARFERVERGIWGLAAWRRDSATFPE
ncbi:MAG: winged helix-turn-helix domain-containing protein [Chloroflexi bacterium]|nr:winged helix-turn-helix domain-containing protein [Chloroflexota bacterium]